MAVLVAHDHYALAAAAAGDKGNLRDVGNDCEGVGAVEQAVRNERVGSPAQLLQNLSGHQQMAFFARRLGMQLGCASNESDACEQAFESDAVAHHENPLVVSPSADAKGRCGASVHASLTHSRHQSQKLSEVERVEK